MLLLLRYYNFSGFFLLLVFGNGINDGNDNDNSYNKPTDRLPTAAGICRERVCLFHAN